VRLADTPSSTVSPHGGRVAIPAKRGTLSAVASEASAGLLISGPAHARGGANGYFGAQFPSFSSAFPGNLGGVSAPLVNPAAEMWMQGASSAVDDGALEELDGDDDGGGDGELEDA
jgi:hypothetical protein